MKHYRLLDTDFYQLSMVFAFVMLDKANEQTGYEGFYRHTKHVVNPNGNFYIFSGESYVHDYITTIRKELKDKNIFNIIWNYLDGKVNPELKEIFLEKCKKLNTSFFYTVVKENSVVFPQIPVFQYKGPRWLGQLIETAITNCYNGRTGLATVNYLKENDLGYISRNDLNYLKDIINNNIKSKHFHHYINELEIRAKEFRYSTPKILLEAGFRRAPTPLVAKLASAIALKNGWNGTSNTMLMENHKEKIGGTMAHAFIQSFENETLAFEAWNSLFPNSTNIIDTIDPLKATDIALKGEKIPQELRIDSGDLIQLTNDVYKKIVDNGLKDKVNIYLSGDITPEQLELFEKMYLPFSKTMAGSKYIYCNELIKKLNAGFVYKIVYQENVPNYPLKQAPGKKNYPGLKRIERFGTNFIVRCKHNNLNSLEEIGKMSVYSGDKIMFVEDD